MGSMLRFVMFTLFVALALPSLAFAETGSFSAAADSYLRSGSKNTNSGSATIMDLNDDRDGIIRFDLSSLPSGSVISSAILTLVATDVGSASAVKNFGAHRVLVDWNEETVTWNTPGSTADTHYTSATTAATAISGTGVYVWDVTSDVASFISGAASNYGWRIIWSSNTNGTSKSVSFGTKENVTAENRPTLSITYTPPPDTTAPGAVDDLSLSNPSASAITVSWTAPGDDGVSIGSATSYDLRYATSLVTEPNWASATQVSGEPTPSAAGFAESMTVGGLLPGTTYYFALKTSDEASNVSVLSNVPNLATTNTPDTTAPAAVMNLAASNPGSGTIVLSWTATGDDGNTGTASSYDIRYAIAAITEGNWSLASPVVGEPTPSAAGMIQSMTISGLLPNTPYYFAMKVADETPNLSGLSNLANMATRPIGGGGGPAVRVILSGKAYPGSTIEVLRKSREDEMYIQFPIEDIQVNQDGAFSISYAGLIDADYLFALRVKDSDGESTGVLAYNVSLYGDRFEARDILVPPTVGFAKSLISKSDVMKIGGYATPGYMLEVEVDGERKGSVKVEASGKWGLDLDTTSLGYGEHQVRARQASVNGALASNFSPMRIFKISQFSAPRADANNDSVVDISDWSIFLFRWDNDNDAVKRENDLNGDGKVNVFDLSLFLHAIKL